MRGSRYCRVARPVIFALSAAPVFAQAAGRARGPAPAPPARRLPPPRGPAPPPAQPPAPFPAGAKIAFVNLAGGVPGVGRRPAAVDPGQRADPKKQTENADKTKPLQGNQQKLQTERQRDERGRARPAREGHRASRPKVPSASSRTRRPRLTSSSSNCRTSSQKKLSAGRRGVAKEKGIQVLSAANAGSWSGHRLDLTLERSRS